MFELLLLIGFVYAGFCPPVPPGRNRDADTARGLLPLIRLPLKKLVQKSSDC